jgi:hypothetical protein
LQPTKKDKTTQGKGFESLSFIAKGSKSIYNNFLETEVYLIMREGCKEAAKGRNSIEKNTLDTRLS